MNRKIPYKRFFKHTDYIEKLQKQAEQGNVRAKEALAWLASFETAIQNSNVGPLKTHTSVAKDTAKSLYNSRNASRRELFSHVTPSEYVDGWTSARKTIGDAHDHYKAVRSYAKKNGIPMATLEPKPKPEPAPLPVKKFTSEEIKAFEQKYFEDKKK